MTVLRKLLELSNGTIANTTDLLEPGTGVPEPHGSSTEPNIMEIILSWQCALLYIMFVAITLVWEYSTSILSFITIRVSGRRALWLERLKGEILALGIITLMLQVTQRALTHICVSGTPITEEDAAICPEGQKPLFTEQMVHNTHYLLFELAVMQILVTTGSFYLCLAALQRWKAWEKNARMGYSLELEEAELLKDLGGTAFIHALRSMWSTVYSNINQALYTLLRILFKKPAEGMEVEKENHVQTPGCSQ